LVSPPVAVDLNQGDSLSVDITQTGGGSNTDSDLSVTITLLVSGAALPLVSALG
jgi:hypothetical protein